MDIIDRINELVELRDREQHNLSSLAKKGWPKKTATLKKRINAWQEEIDRLYAPFGPTESNLRSFMEDLRQLLNAIPLQPLELGQLRLEIERLDLPSNIQKKWPPLGMRASYNELLIIKGRLGEMLAYLPAGDNSEGQASALHQPHVVTAPQNERRHRGPNIEKSQKRVELEDRLIYELGTIRHRTEQYVELDQLKKEFPDFALWEMLSPEEQGGLLTEALKPKTYARALTLRKFGLTNPETIKKDRQKLAKAQ